MAGECILGQGLRSWVLWLGSEGSERHQRQNPAPAEEGACSPKNDFAFSFSVFPHTFFWGGGKGEVNSFFPSIFSLLFPSLTRLSAPHQSLLCHQLPFFATPCGDLTKTGARLPAPAPSASPRTNTRAGAATMRSSSEGESLCPLAIQDRTVLTS